MGGSRFSPDVDQKRKKVIRQKEKGIIISVKICVMRAFKN